MKTGDGRDLFTTAPFAREGTPVVFHARGTEYPHLPTDHLLLMLNVQEFACGDKGLVLVCSCGAEGAAVISNGGCGPGTHMNAGAPPIDSLHMDLISLATSQILLVKKHGGIVSAS